MNTILGHFRVSSIATLLIGAHLGGCDRTGSSAPPRGSDEGAATATSASSDSCAVLFSDATEDSGIRFTHDPGLSGEFYFPEIMGSGGAWLDIDNDGDLDAYLVQGGKVIGSTGAAKPNQLFRNDAGVFVDVTEGSGLGDTGYGMGCCVGDVDNDGDSDVYVTNVGENRLYLNDGTGRFSDATEQAGVGDPGWGTSCAFVDYDRDNDLDLFVVNYIRWSIARERPCRHISGRRDYCAPGSYNAPAHGILYRNEGGGIFTDVTGPAGMADRLGNGLGVVCGDLNQDGWVDIYVANDKMDNFLWLNQHDGTFKEEGLLAGVAVNEIGMAEASMGVDAADPDRDDDLDLFMTHLTNETHTFYRNIRPGQFLDHTKRLRFNTWSYEPTGFGTMFFDYDHDGLLDLFVANGRVLLGNDPGTENADPYAQRNTLIHQDAAEMYREVTGEAGPALRAEHVSRGAMFGDYDNDGDLDILISNNRGPVQLLRNDAPKRGHWLMIRATTGQPPRDAIGAVIRAELDDATVVRRDVRPAGGYCGSNDPRVHLTFAQDRRVKALHVEWPDGSRESFEPPQPDRLVTIHQTTGADRTGEPAG